LIDIFDIVAKLGVIQKGRSFMNVAAPHYLLNRTAITPIEFDYDRCIADFSLNQLADLPAELGTTFANFLAQLKDRCPTIAAAFEAKLVASMHGDTQVFLVEFPLLTNHGFSWYQIIGQAFGDNDQRKIRLKLVDVSAQRFCEVNERIANSSIDLEHHGLVVADATSANRELLFVNQAFEQISGYTVHEAVGRNCRFMQGFDHDQPGLVSLKGGMNALIPCTSLVNNFRKDGSLFINELTIFPVFNASKKPVFFVGVQRDLTFEQKAKTEQKTSLERERIASKFAHLGSFEVNTVDFSVDSKGYAADVLGLDADTKLSLSVLTNSVVSEDRIRFEKCFIDCLAGDSGIDLEYRIVLPNGRQRWLQTKGQLFKQADDSESRLICISQDVTERHIIDQRNRYIAQHDALTGLPNRAVMRDRCDQMLSVAKRDNSLVALMFIDLDDFKSVNDTHGHQVGDELLKQVARRLKNTVREADTVCRQSGDEFIVILQNLADNLAIEQCIKKIHAALLQPYQIGDLKIKGSASIGISCAPADGLTTDELVRRADMAMYSAKRKGAGRYAFASNAIGQQISSSQDMRNELFEAVARNELVLFYQPQLDARSSKLVGLEALLRWRHPSRGLLTPSQFLPVAGGSNDLLFAIEEWAFREAIEQRCRWKSKGQFQDVPVFINLTPEFFSDDRFQIKLASYLHASVCPPGLIGLEIAESAIWRGDSEDDVGLENRLDKLRFLDAMGLRLTIDNYGSGGSTIAQLAKCPVDSIKLDQSWLANLVSDRSALNALSAVANLSRSLHLQVITQAIESKHQAQTASRLGFDTLQGNLWCTPVNSFEIERFLDQFHPCDSQQAANYRH
jgi:diguanylate cyclase (GGDEF)-like protein/PAS domain S-box-containing protein